MLFELIGKSLHNKKDFDILNRKYHVILKAERKCNKKFPRCAIIWK
jgi:hypothetical protein